MRFHQLYYKKRGKGRSLNVLYPVFFIEIADILIGAHKLGEHELFRGSVVESDSFFARADTRFDLDVGGEGLGYWQSAALEKAHIGAPFRTIGFVSIIAEVVGICNNYA